MHARKCAFSFPATHTHIRTGVYSHSGIKDKEGERERRRYRDDAPQRQGSYNRTTSHIYTDTDTEP